ncbi:Uncharacterised protein [Yersinia pekkanenii]|uniref:Uncharacterized protein n=1 Tax=Yersinia pekkanenii TaxID=1288385 RepID=A0A0T9PKZ7_9GAMM|nr:Uncharacterised protein [Yersinia pekkanenii]CRY68193.1 Uncharacterised protein [Yersinia pekkanenii]
MLNEKLFTDDGTFKINVIIDVKIYIYIATYAG